MLCYALRAAIVGLVMCKRGRLHGAYGANRREKLCMGDDWKKEMNM